MCALQRCKLIVNTRLSVIELNHTTLSYAADQTPVLILHGLFGSQKNWGSLARKLADQHSITTVDLRNHGQSPHANSMAYPDMAADIIQLLDKLNYESVILIGHSMGGKVAMNCALAYPQRIKNLIVADIAPVNYQHGFDQIIAAQKALPLEHITNRAEADQFLSQYIDQPTLRQFLLQNLVKNAVQFSWRVNLTAIDDQMPIITNFPVISANKNFEKKTLFLRGENSDYLLEEHHAAIKNYFPNSSIQTLPDCGHWLHAEQPQLFYQSVLEYLDENAN